LRTFGFGMTQQQQTRHIPARLDSGQIVVPVPGVNFQLGLGRNGIRR
jgi:hypothetical protein